MDKNELTKKLLRQLAMSAGAANIKKYSQLWWQSPRNTKENGLRLTDLGYKVLTEQLDLKSYQVAIPEDTIWTNELLLRLDKFLDSPYYITPKFIIVFRERTMVELVLFDSNIQKYTQAKAKSKAKTD
jgi:hypothetical protein